ncbi:iron ABC transporter permease [Kiloniella laminariae]|uniref:Iron ABC transporter permease n=1 Tax=Kiloniella laminariae TaxID=454162 RepID=A0ABT4LF39_9PROT|nr:iron ABC transporter permease [Kiloniella laminariae]MCZ4279540.1 iron ABC transporter permease [Kiloniella laminariae]
MSKFQALSPNSYGAARRQKAAPFFLVTGIAAVAVTVGLLGLGIGAQYIPVSEIIRVLWLPDDSVSSIILWELRLPRMLIALLAGASLAVAGYLLQSITRNPLASPSLTGVTSGAAMLVVLAFVCLPQLISPYYYPFLALFGGTAAASITLFLSGPTLSSPLRLALAGVSVSFLAAAVTTLTLLSAGPQTGTLLFWLSGGLQGRSWSQLLIMLPWVVPGLVCVFFCLRPLALLSLGDEPAQAMGVNVRLWRSLLALLAICLSAGVVAVAGPIAFVGLCVPHMARMLGARTTGTAVALSLALGALLLVSADLFSRTLAAPRELPIGMITALIGGPIFLAIIYRQKA